MRVAIVWAYISGYMASCWRLLAEQQGIELLVLAQNSVTQSAMTEFDEGIMRGIPNIMLPGEGRIDEASLRRQLAAFRPDIVVINGWHTPAYVAIPTFPELARAKFIMAMDTPYLGTLRQRLGRFKFPRYFASLDRVFVTGERCWQLAKVLGFRERIIRRGVYGVDYDLLAPLHARRMAQPGGWPRRFLYTGRYIEEKAIDVMLEAYSRYRRRVSDPWPMTCCGKGPMDSLIASAEGVEDRGFIQPDQMPGVMAEHGVFVLASRFDPWPLVIVEACAAGMPVICTEACGSRVELVRSCYNGMTCETGDPETLAGGMRYMHENHDKLPAMGAGSRGMAEPYSAQMWVERWVTEFHELMGVARAAPVLERVAR